MPKYRYKCPLCGSEYLRYKRIENIDEPEYCRHESIAEGRETPPDLVFPMQRLFTASFQIIAQRAADQDENKLYKILTKGSGATDELALMREDAARLDKTMESMPDAPKEWTTEDTLGTGIIEAAQSGQEGIANWRKAHIPAEKKWKDGETIGA